MRVTLLVGAPVIDAYATILSADSDFTAQKAPARLAILDVASSSYPTGYPDDFVTRDRVVDINDAKLFVTKLFPLDPPDPDHLLNPGDNKKIAPPPTKPDYSRYDLNGDGYTGGKTLTRFNLDISYDASGGSIYSTAAYDYAGDTTQKAALDENKLSDLQILCYYVHSRLFKTADLAAFNAYLDRLSATKGIPSCRPSRINDTGITACSNGVSPGLPCPVDGYPWQDAEYGRDKTDNDDRDGHAGFSFTKIGSLGEELSAKAVSWSCLRGNVIGLI